jgi:hypothetical protein
MQLRESLSTLSHDEITELHLLVGILMQSRWNPALEIPWSKVDTPKEGA